MTKRNRIIYWVATGWLALGMLSTGVVQLLKRKEEVDLMTHLGYPLYFLTILGIWKILGVITILIPKFPLLKEWAYAGFFFAMSGAVISHLAMGEIDGVGARDFVLAEQEVAGLAFGGNDQGIEFHRFLRRGGWGGLGGERTCGSEQQRKGEPVFKGMGGQFHGRFGIDVSAWKMGFSLRLRMWECLARGSSLQVATTSTARGAEGAGRSVARRRRNQIRKPVTASTPGVSPPRHQRIFTGRPPKVP